MSNYTITTDFGAKDRLPSGNAAKVIKGSEFSAEFTNIKTAVNSKADSVSPTFTGDTALNGTTTFGPDGTSTFNGTVNFTKDVTFDTDTMFVDVSENRVGIGTTSPDYTLDIKADTAQARIHSTVGNSVLRLDSVDTGESKIFFADNSASAIGTIEYHHDDNYMSFDTVATERMRIDSSGNVGIGTSSPSEALEVNGKVKADTHFTSSDNAVTLSTSGNGGNVYLRPNGATQASGQVIVDSSGNVGIGTDDPQDALHINSDTTDARILLDGHTNFDAELKFAENGSIKYTVGHDAATDSFRIGTTNVDTNPRLVINSSGNVGIGTTNPEAKLHVQSGGEAIRVNTANENTHISFGAARAKFGYARIGTADMACIQGDTGKGIAFCTNNETFGSGEKVRIDSSGKVGIGRTPTSHILETQGEIKLVSLGASEGIDAFNTNSVQWGIKTASATVGGVTFEVDNTERMRIDSSGNVGIGTTSPDFPLDVVKVGTSGSGSIGIVPDSDNGHYIRYGGNGTNNDVFRLLGVGDLERMRIDTSGNLMVGRTSGSASSNSNGIVLSPTGFIYSAKDGTSAQTHIGFINNTDATATSVGSIRTSGSATSYNTSSDERLKENITDSADAGSKIDAIQIRQFDWIADGSHQDYGVIAQELLEVAPEAVSEGDTEEDMMGVDYSKLVPMLIKEIQTLRNRVAQLENN